MKKGFKRRRLSDPIDALIIGNGNIGDTISTPSSKSKSFSKNFIRKQHAQQCNDVLGNRHHGVHLLMDKKTGGGPMHRRFGHNRAFINAHFSGDEKLAAYIHLLGDYILHILPDVIEYTIGSIKKGDVESPFFEEYDGKSRWDITDEVKQWLQNQWGLTLVEALKLPRKKDRQQ